MKSRKKKFIKIFLAIIILVLAMIIFLKVNDIKIGDILGIQGNQQGYYTNENLKLEDNQEKYDTNEIETNEDIIQQEENISDDELQMDSPQQDTTTIAASNTIKILFVKYDGYTSRVFDLIDAKLRANPRFEVESKFFGGEEKISLSDYVLSKKGQYDLFIADAGVWSAVPGSSVMSQIFESANIITIGDDCTSAKIPMIESQVKVDSTVEITPTMTAACKSKLNLSIPTYPSGRSAISKI